MSSGEALVTLALHTASAAKDAHSSQLAYERLLDAAGSNHAGTYNEDALRLLFSLRPISSSLPSWGVRAALEALVDLYGSFEPDTGKGKAADAILKAQLRALVRSMRPWFVATASTPSEAQASARLLLEGFEGDQAT